MFVEYAQYIENHDYRIVQEIWTTVPYEIKVYLIKDKTVRKYNAYFLDYWAEGTQPSDAKTIVKMHNPVPLESAQEIFEGFHLTEDNYGF